MNIARKTIESHDGLAIYYETHNLGSGKEVIFFVHGAGGDVDSWEFVRQPLIEKNFAGISMDLRGHGYSSHPRAAQKYQIENLVKDILTILGEEKIDKVVLIGHSYGAVVAANFAIVHSNRLIKLVLISGAIKAPNYLKSKSRKVLVHAIISLAAKISPPQVKKWHSPYPIGKFHKDYEVKGLIRTIFYNSWGSYLLTSKQTIDLDLESKLNKISVPTLVIVGTKDSIFPLEVSRKIHEAIPNSKLEVIEGANHVVILNHPKETVMLVSKFLNP
jgi:pimeloyl-ACP methyl ester carboxylesterase